MRSVLLPLLLFPAMAFAVPDRRPARLPDPAALCETAVNATESAARLPPGLLQAISVTESGRIDAMTGQLRPWPWTINAEGQGQFFATRDEAVAAVRALRDRGVQSIDVGCLQVNLMYHPRAFASLEDAFDPRANARYAAGFLNALYAASGDWFRAVGAYHSETPLLGDAYRVLVQARWQNPDLRKPPASASAYRAFVPREQVYGAFAQPNRVYGAFSQADGATR